MTSAERRLSPEASGSGATRARRSAGSGRPRPRLGDYLLVTLLTEDALGAVYRAIHVDDERFMRLRLITSAELPRTDLVAAIQDREAPHRRRSFHRPGRRETLGIAEGCPFLAWHETSGWTLDGVLAAARRAGAPVPVSWAVKIVLGAALALEHAGAAVVGHEPTRHGLVWPGFVTISRNGEVWVRGYGLAPAVLPSIGEPRLSRLLAAYVAPEARQPGGEELTDDVYSLGILLLELLTGRRPSVERLPEFEPGDVFGKDVAEVARAAVASRGERLSSVIAVRERLQQLLADCPYEAPDAGLLLYLEDLMRPERRTAEAPTNVSASFTAFPIERRRRPSEESAAARRGRALRVAAAISAIAVLAGTEPLIRHGEPDDVSRARVAAPLPVARTQDLAIQTAMLPGRSSGAYAVGSSVDAQQSPAHARRGIRLSRQASALAESWRLRAALSRVAAQRIDSPTLVSQTYLAAADCEREGERFLARRRFARAQEVFEQAADLYVRAEALAHEEKARLIRLAAPENEPAF
jgi:hypothetical protein